MDKFARKKKKFLEALREGHGLISYACRKVGVSRELFYRYKKKDEAFAKEVEEIDNETIDIVESKLLSKINDGDVTSIIFYLKTKGKKRGYIERTEHDVNANPFQELMESIGSDED